MKTFEKIEKILKENYDIENITPESEFRADLGLNSFELMELVCIAEEELGFEMDEGEYRKIITVKEMCDYLERIGYGH